MIILITCLTIFNTVMLINLSAHIIKLQPASGTIAMYEEQIKNLKKIGRLNEKYIKLVKEKEEPKHEQSMVQPQEQRRVY